MKLRLIALIVIAGLLTGTSSAAVARALPGHFATPYSNLAWFLVAFELGPWEDYLIHELTPELESLSSESSPRVSWLQLDEGLILPDFALSLLHHRQSPPLLSLVRQDLAIGQFNGGSAVQSGHTLERSLLMPGVTTRMSENSAVTVSAVLATQRFVSSGMNLSDGTDASQMASGSRWHGLNREDLAQGAGVRFAVAGEPVDGVSVEASYQSRIDMNDFASLRGVHGSSAELDIPSRIQLGLRLHASSRSSINLGVSQIFYSEVGAFPSRALPARFNALLGDSASPQFNWEDLLVYSIGWSWQADRELTLFVDYRSRTQPRPSAPSLASALAPELAQNALLMGVNKALGERSRFELNAAYAPPEFAFGGNVLGVVSDRIDQSLELQAIWRTNF